MMPGTPFILSLHRNVISPYKYAQKIPCSTTRSVIAYSTLKTSYASGFHNREVSHTIHHNKPHLMECVLSGSKQILSCSLTNPTATLALSHHSTWLRQPMGGLLKILHGPNIVTYHILFSGKALICSTTKMFDSTSAGRILHI